MEINSKKKLEKFLENLKETQGENWKQTIEENKGEFEEIKGKIRQKQNELTSLVKKKNALTIGNEEFEEQTKIIQEELYELESRILNLRLKMNE